MNRLADEEQTIAKPGIVSPKQIIAAVVFAALAVFLATVVPTVEIAWVSAILMLSIYLFAFEVVGVDVAAATVMVLLGLTSLLAPFMG
ncbi:MAG: SLC13 family permease, partial [Thiogranum sp.]